MEFSEATAVLPMDFADELRWVTMQFYPYAPNILCQTEGCSR
jgi:hypothetical protein